MRRIAIPSIVSGLIFTGISPAAVASPTQPGQLVNPLEGNFGCVTCHAFNNIEPHLDEPPYAPWGQTGTLMANAARDPVFWGAVALAAQDSPGDTEDCIRCHSPAAFANGNQAAIAMDELSGVELEGINCDFCHRQVWDGITEAGNAQYEIDDVLDMATMTVPKRGPWAYEAGTHMGHPTLQDVSFLGTSRFCGTCHDVTTHRERVDDQGQGMGFDFNEQRTYSEWLNSDFADETNESAATCQDCHMPAIEDAAGCFDFNTPDLLHPTGARRHDLVGANRFMLEILGEDYGNPIPTDPFQVAIANLDAFLPTAATLEVTFPESVDLAQGISGWATRVTNNSGHKLPTGYSEGRVMWLEIVASYDGEVVYSSGRWDEDLLTIEDDAQVRRYEGVAEDADDGTQLHLLRNNRWISDTRIPPKGLHEDIQTDPVNAPYELQMDGTWPHWDDASYDFGAAEVIEHEGAAAELDLSVRLLYLINTDEYIQTLADDNVTNSAGNDVAQRFELSGNAKPLVIAEASSTVPLTGLMPMPTGEESGTESSTESTGSEESSTESSTDESEETTSADEEGGGGSCDCRADRNGPDAAGLLGLFGLLWWRRRRGA